MNEAEFCIRTEQDTVLTLHAAVLIYRGSQGGAFATVHDIAQVEGEQAILAGKAMTPRAALALSSELAGAVRYKGFLPETVLYTDGDLLIWWVPPLTRHIAFRAEALGAPERGEIVPHPGLVFAASTRVWKVWAVKCDERPTPETDLYQAPYFNVWKDGTICQGNVSVPDCAIAQRIEAWNAAFFGSFFTHPNVQKGLVKYRGGSYRFWKDMLDAKFKAFPQKVLVPLNATLGELLARSETRE